RGGTNSGTVGYADFAQSIEGFNSYAQASATGSYTVRAGDTLASIAAQLYGDANLWYRLAEANGLSAQAGLIEGSTLILPQGVAKNSHNAGTFQPYDPSEVMGETQPTTPKPPKKAKCGLLGQMLLLVIAQAVTMIATIALAPVLGPVAPVAGAAIGSAVSQGVGVATGIQPEFSWKAVGMAAVRAGVQVVIGAPQGFDPVTTIANEAVSQGIGMALGLQKKFDWTGVATAVASNAVGELKIGDSSFGGEMLRSGADVLARAATRSVITGDSFGRSIRTELPAALARLAVRAAGTAFDGRLGNSSASEGAGNPTAVEETGGNMIAAAKASEPYPFVSALNTPETLAVDVVDFDIPALSVLDGDIDWDKVAANRARARVSVDADPSAMEIVKTNASTTATASTFYVTTSDQRIRAFGGPNPISSVEHLLQLALADKHLAEGYEAYYKDGAVYGNMLAAELAAGAKGRETAVFWALGAATTNAIEVGMGADFISKAEAVLMTRLNPAPVTIDFAIPLPGAGMMQMNIALPGTNRYSTAFTSGLWSKSKARTEIYRQRGDERAAAAAQRQAIANVRSQAERDIAGFSPLGTLYAFNDLRTQGHNAPITSKIEAGAAFLGPASSLVGRVGGKVFAKSAPVIAAERGLGSISVPSNLKYGTTLFGQEAHVQAGALLQARLEAQGVTGVINRTGPGLTGVDMSVDSIAARRLGFEHIEIKPNTASGLKTFNTQVGKWGYDPATVRAVTYDAQGNLRWGFDF
ncbi:LysM domain-containing protein, partial [Sphingorhabdus sp.]|uniref:LysM peptidoglycan-binding domain-containing protein n=1 Tax=Sphingorhabdus sp. TaxID=1902408 RepID=UPI0032B7DD01